MATPSEPDVYSCSFPGFNPRHKSSSMPTSPLCPGLTHPPVSFPGSSFSTHPPPPSGAAPPGPSATPSAYYPSPSYTSGFPSGLPLNLCLRHLFSLTQPKPHPVLSSPIYSPALQAQTYDAEDWSEIPPCPHGVSTGIGRAAPLPGDSCDTE
ncbi:uncharacterized protein LOC135101788 [Scylla paramamosain]|uniref:uncharacterized protein LOC135101788 n=1 Tax=Scylla paramamosain TaxID=85552 RepID=UPI003083B44B